MKEYRKLNSNLYSESLKLKYLQALPAQPSDDLVFIEGDGFYIYQNNAWTKVLNVTPPSGNSETFVGEIKPMITTPNSDWLLCDGSSFDPLEYPELYTLLGNTAYVPDLREAILAGVGTNTTYTIAAHNPIQCVGDLLPAKMQNHCHNCVICNHTHGLKGDANHYHYCTPYAGLTSAVGPGMFSVCCGTVFTQQIDCTTNSARYCLSLACNCSNIFVNNICVSSPDIRSPIEGILVRSYGVNFYIKGR